MFVREKAGGFDRKPKLCSVDLVDLLLEDSVVWGVARVKVPKRFLDDLAELVEALLIHRRHGCARARFRAPRAIMPSCTREFLSKRTTRTLRSSVIWSTVLRFLTFVEQKKVQRS